MTDCETIVLLESLKNKKSNNYAEYHLAIKAALSLINRQKATIEQLKKELCEKTH